MKVLIFVAVLSFGAGVALMDTLHEPERASCKQTETLGKRYASTLANILNGGGFETEDVYVSCRVVPLRKEF